MLCERINVSEGTNNQITEGHKNCLNFRIQENSGIQFCGLEYRNIKFFSFVFCDHIVVIIFHSHFWLSVTIMISDNVALGKYQQGVIY